MKIFGLELGGNRDNKQPSVGAMPDAMTTNAPSAASTESSLNVPSPIFDPLVTSRPPMPEATPSISPEPQPTINNTIPTETPMTAASVPDSAPAVSMVDSAPPTPDAAPTITTIDSATSAPITGDVQSEPIPVTNGTPDQQAA